MAHRRTTGVSAVGALLAAAVLTLGGCDSGASSDAGSGRGGKPSDGPSVIVPGKPGEGARTMSAEDAAEKRADDDRPNAADFTYAQMMVVHHAQALEMTRLAPKRAESAKVRGLAERITAAQRPEIDAMKAWLKHHGGPRRNASGHHHDTMPGMATDAQLGELRAARGKEFDQLFLTLMTTHHQGAVTMATDALAQGNNVQIEEMANEVVVQQSAEIERMRKMG
ncbi:DUF305 domain-containing protein [Streptomyces sp. NPDC059009]|uniref:DUF305 domain-containing protein n=1 Tax=Streptomyces sp. NPDC059009 TaxID=3346694 RepID=UPI00369003DF